MTAIITIYLYNDNPIIIAVNNVEPSMLSHSYYVQAIKDRVRRTCIDRALTTQENIRYVSFRPINYVDNMAVVQ